MSGGHFDYTDSQAKNEIFGWTDKPTNVFEDREISELIFDVFDLIHDYDWYVSGDTDENDWLKAKRAFKAKWLHSPPEERTKAIIDAVIDDARQELYKTFLSCKDGTSIDLE